VSHLDKVDLCVHLRQHQPEQDRGVHCDFFFFVICGSSSIDMIVSIHRASSSRSHLDKVDLCIHLRQHQPEEDGGVHSLPDESEVGGDAQLGNVDARHANILLNIGRPNAC